MAVQGERILAVGAKEDILALAPGSAAREDLEGQVVIPGLGDSHMHLLNWGLAMDGVELAGAGSIQELIALGQAYVHSNPGREWILGRGFNHELFSPPRLPTRRPGSGLNGASRDLHQGMRSYLYGQLQGPGAGRD